MREEASIPPKDMPDRRMSMSWKKFNFKRQLSKVNMKIGIETAPKSSSVFYTQKECSPEDAENSPPKEPVAMGVEARESMTENSLADTVDKMAEDSSSFEEKDTTPTEYVFETVQQALKRVEVTDDSNSQSLRPDNLPLSPINTAGNIPDTAGSNDSAPPARPPRQKLKEKRDQRLLSVPNIKYQMRDMRSRQNRNDASPSVGGAAAGGVVGGGGVTKKTRKYSILLSLILSNTTTTLLYIYICVCAVSPSTTLNKPKSAKSKSLFSNSNKSQKIIKSINY